MATGELKTNPEQPEDSPENGDSKKPRPKRGVPSGLWLRCIDCGETVFRKTVAET